MLILFFLSVLFNDCLCFTLWVYLTPFFKLWWQIWFFLFCDCCFMVIGNSSVSHFCTDIDGQTLRKMWQYQLEPSGKSSFVERACTIIYLKAWLHNAVFGVTCPTMPFIGYFWQCWLWMGPILETDKMYCCSLSVGHLLSCDGISLTYFICTCPWCCRTVKKVGRISWRSNSTKVQLVALWKYWSSWCKFGIVGCPVYLWPNVCIFQKEKKRR